MKGESLLPVGIALTFAGALSIVAPGENGPDTPNKYPPSSDSDIVATLQAMPRLLEQTPRPLATSPRIQIDYPTIHNDYAQTDGANHPDKTLDSLINEPKPTPQPHMSNEQTGIIKHNLFTMPYGPSFFRTIPPENFNQFGETIVEVIKTRVEAQHSAKAIIAYEDLEKPTSLNDYTQARLDEFKKIPWFDAEIFGSRVVSGQEANIIHYTYKKHGLKTEVFHVIFFTNNQAWSIEFSYTTPAKNPHPNYARGKINDLDQMLNGMAVKKLQSYP